MANIAGHQVISATTPSADPVAVGWEWADTATNTLKMCTSTSPFTFVTIGAAGAGGPSPSSVTPVVVDSGAAAIGTSVDYARADHKHALANPVVANLTGNVTGNVTGNLTGNVTGSVTGNASTATALQTPRAINGVNFDGTAPITVTAAAGTLTGTTLASNVLASSLTSVGTLLDLTVTNTITGSISGNAATATTLVNDAQLTGSITIVGTASAHTGLLTVTQNYAGDGLERAIVKVRRDSQANSGTPTIGDGAEVLFQLKDTSGNYGNIAGIIGRMVTVAPMTMKGRMELAVKNTGTFSTTFDETKMIIDWDGKVGIGTAFGTISTAPTDSLHILDGTASAVAESTGVGGAAGWCVVNQSQRYNMGITAAKQWVLFDSTASANRITVEPTTGAVTIAGTLASGQITANLTGAVTGNASTATTLQTARAINGVNFDGSAAITVTAAAGTLTGTTLNATVVSSSLTSVGTLAALTVTATITGSISGNAGTATKLATARAINGTNFDGSADITVTAAAGTLTGTTLNATVVTSSLTSVGTIGTGVWQGTAVAKGFGGTGVDNTTQTFTPTLTNVTNLDSTTAAVCQYVRIGNTVIVSGQFAADPTTSGIDTEFGMSLPIASNLTNGARECGGTATVRDIASEIVAIAGDGTNHRADFRWTTVSNTNRTYRFMFMYLVN